MIDIDLILAKKDFAHIENEIKSRNELPDDAYVKVIHVYSSPKYTNLILEVNATAYEIIMKEGKIDIAYSRCKVHDDYNINICHDCCNYNHSFKSCCKKKDVKQCCTYCAGNHSYTIGENKQALKCIHCTSKKWEI